LFLLREVEMPEIIEQEKYDFRPIGTAIKRARQDRGISREKLAEICDISPGYIKAIENSGKNPGFQLFWRLITMFNISVDEYFYPERAPAADSHFRNIMGMLGEITTNDVYIVESLVISMAQRGADDGTEQAP
jgi:transcriptional regulator with XRE-family HTH domain